MTGNQMVMGEGALSRAAAMVAGARHDFDRMGSELEGRIAGLRGAWAGAGGQAFFLLHQAWSDRQRTVVGALDRFEAALLAAERDVTGADDAQAAHLAALTARLG